MTRMRTWLRFLAETVYPTCCPACEKATHSESVWCEECLRLFWDPRHIQICGEKYLSDCYTLCRYEKGIRKCILQLKYGKRRERTRAFIPLLNRFPYWDRLGEYDWVIPIPLSKAHLAERSYNQVDLIFQRTFQRKKRLYISGGLIRKHNTEVQSVLSRRQRYQNMKDAFLISPDIHIQEKRILLVDDVYTTGATMNSAARVLKRGGAKSVVGLTVASGAY